LRERGERERQRKTDRGTERERLLGNPLSNCAAREIDAYKCVNERKSERARERKGESEILGARDNVVGWGPAGGACPNN
jgi:hypothetical protein